MSGTLVVGASHAGVQVAASLRELGYDAPVTVVGEEPAAPYQRPPLSKSFLLGRTAEPALALRTADYYAQQRIEVRTDERVTELDPDAGKAVTDSGAVLGFDHVVLATGARVRPLLVPGAALDGVETFRTLKDARALARRLETAGDVVVVGGGFIGLEIAAVAAKLGKRVSVVEAAERLMARVVSFPISDFFLDRHRDWGVSVELGVGVAAIVEGAPGRVGGVLLADGRTVAADLIIVGIGVEPCVELARAAEIESDQGVLVDDLMRAGHPRVLAVGDCAAMRHADGRVLRLESVQNAVDQARTAAATIVGRPAPYSAVPWFWSEQGDLRLQIAGVPAADDDVVIRRSEETGRICVLHFARGQLTAAECVNSPADYMTARRALESGRNIDAGRARRPDVSLKSCLSDVDGEAR